MSYLKRLRINLCLLFATIIIFAGVAEVGLIILKVNTKSNIQFVPGKGSTHVPHAFYRHTKEGFSEGYFNSHGFRDYERTHSKPENSFRILVLGDSYTEALHVPLEHSFPALLEKYLNERIGGTRFEVLNLGQSGFGTADAYMRFSNFGVHYSPDLVLLAFLTGNDFRNNSKVLNKENIAFYFNINENGELVLDSTAFDEYQKNLTFPKRIFQWIKRRSYLASLISERIFLLKQEYRESQFKADFENNLPKDDKKKLDEFSGLNIYLSHPSSHWQEAFEITMGLLIKLRELVETQGRKFVLVTLSNAEQVHPFVQAKVEKAYPNLFDFDRPDRLLEEFAKDKGIEMLKLLPEFQKHHRLTGRNLHGFNTQGRGHWNDAGHQLAAEKIFEFLIDNHMVPSAPHS